MLLEMFTKIIILLSLSIHTLSGGLRHPNSMTTVSLKPHVTISSGANEFITYQSQSKYTSLYYPNNTLK
jgi:hypothetical protein